jgi:predicted ribosomally synthesized peptide with nif11-like leader
MDLAYHLSGVLLYLRFGRIVKAHFSEGASIMSRSELSRFLEALRNDPRLLDESRTLLRDPGSALRWAQGMGYLLTPAEIQELLDCDRELSDEDLDQAAGGDWPPA